MPLYISSKSACSISFLRIQITKNYTCTLFHSRTLMHLQISCAILKFVICREVKVHLVFLVAGVASYNMRKRQPVNYDVSSDTSEDEEMSPYSRKMKKMAEKGVLEKFREMENLRQQINFAMHSPEQRKRYNHLAKMRMRKYRAKKKEEEEQRRRLRSNAAELELEQQARREYWRNQQRNRRARQKSKGSASVSSSSSRASSPDLQASSPDVSPARNYTWMSSVSEINTVMYQSTTHSVTPPSAPVSTPKPPTGPVGVPEGAKMSDKRNASAKRSARYRAHMPKSPRKWVNTLVDMISKATPRKKKHLQRMGLTSPEKNCANAAIVELLKQQAQSKAQERNDRSRKTRQFCANAARKAKKIAGAKTVRELIGMRWSKLVRSSILEAEDITRKRRSDALTEDEVKEVADFYDEITIPVANVRVIRKDGKMKRMLPETLAHAHQKFTAKKDRGISLSKFKKLRPSHILTVDQGKFVQCLCEICTNLDEKVKALARKARDRGVTLNVELTVNGLSKATLCPKDDGHQMDCIWRQCSNCGVCKLDDVLAPILAVKDEELKWATWKTVEKKRGRTSEKRKCLVETTSTVDELLQEMKKECTKIPCHIFDANWQYQAFNQAKKNLPDHTVLMVLDFAENYRTSYQNEVQSAHWSYNQVTVHPLVCYYKCPNPQCEEQTTESVVIISSDLIHDADAVKKYRAETLAYLTKKGVKVDRVIEFTDGAASQYKSRKPFLHISQSAVPTERCFFGSRHGKGPADGVSAVVKSAVTRAAKAGKIIDDAASMYTYLAENMSLEEDTKNVCGRHTLRHFILIEEVERAATTAGIIQGTQQLHSVRSIGKEGHLQVRILSCHCNNCISSEEGCENKDVVDEWKTVVIKGSKQCKIDCKIMAARKNLFRKMSNTDVTDVSTEKAMQVNTTASEHIIGKEQQTQKRKISENPRANNEQKSKKTKSTSKKQNEHATSKENKNGIASSTSKTSLNKDSHMEQNNKENDHKVKKSEPTSIGTKKNRSSTKSVKTNKKKPWRLTKICITDNEQEEGDNKETCRKGQNVTDTGRTSQSSVPKMYSGPVPEKDMKRLSCALIHSPREIQLSTCDNVKFTDITVRRDLSVVELNATVDKMALAQLPKDLSSFLYPVMIEADGNCLSRCGSVLAYGTEAHHIDVRLRIAVELIRHKEYYLSDKHFEGRHFQAEAIARLSDKCKQHNIVPDELERIYQAEVHQTLKVNEYMGMWQLMALSSVLGIALFSVYPPFGPEAHRQTLHRCILPRTASEPVDIAYVMWCSTREDMQPEYWVANHFTLLLPMDGSEYSR